MASFTPAAVQNENFHIHRVHGKGGHGVKSSAAKPGLQERKPLRDLSNANKPLAPSARKASALKERTFVKEKSVARVRETIKNVPKSNLLTDEDIKKCHEWAKEGVERAHFTGNDLQKLQKDQQEQRVRKEVEEVVSALHEWNRAFDFGMPKKKILVAEEVTKLELLPEVLPPRTSLCRNSGNQEIDILLEPELYSFPFLDNPIEFKLKEVYDDGM